MSQRGWGGSVAMGGRHDLHALANNALTVTEALAVPRFAVVGHSMGGKVAPDPLRAAGLEGQGRGRVAVRG